ncbi:GNAT family N-acetyltransferase [Mycolicibacterium sp. S2-37]|uniref:GNAT family N-acetyltransferase n=1 Tax=Mycolicibacterium sp. S2-37 TaxID=2810297 RepID=UPI001A94A2FC|nr:GNAT family N-acetyltransferase [Mycolicibacterium sp. S2-37]MBO0678600.1 GNAT family N-acetyltransferase [Mycolicibacterium sp. S2-37]
MDQHTVRRADAADVAAVERVVAASFGHYVERIGRPPAPMTHDYRALVDTARVWVVETPAGIGAVLVTVEHPDHVLLDTVAVAPDAQGSGFGALLLARAEDDARELGVPEVRLYTNLAMTENQTFYPRHGYTESGRGHEDGYDRVFYVKRVDGSATAR